MKLGEKLRQLRNNKFMSQEKFAEEMNVSRQAVSKWELNQSLPEMDKLIEISDYFNVTLDYLVKNEEINDFKETSNGNLSNQKSLHEKKDLNIFSFDMMIMLIPVVLALSAITLMNMGNFLSGSVLAVVSCVIIVGVNIVKFDKIIMIIKLTAMVLALTSIRFMIMGEFMPGLVLAVVSCVMFIRFNHAKYKRIKHQ